MPPKKRGAAKAKATPAKRGRRATKRTKVEEEEEEEVELEEEEEEEEEEVTTKKATKAEDSIITKLIAADKNNKKPKVYFPDKHVPGYSTLSVYGDYDCMLNQTNIGNNNNKFYIIQVLESGRDYYCWNRWGRVGEVGQNNGLEHYSDVDSAIKSFEKKFKDKTKNDWKNKDNFKPVSGKYTLIEMDNSNEEEQVSVPEISSLDAKQYMPSKLDAATQSFINLIFDQDMFKSALKTYDIDVKKMPLGKLSKTQIAKGFEVLEDIEALLKSKTKSTAKINDLSSKFYTVIPQDFGRQRPPPIADEESLQKKYDMLTVLSDIELAQTMQEESEKERASVKETNKLPHPLDSNYDLLKCKLKLVDKKSDIFKIIDTYTKETQGYCKCQILEVWEVEREGEDTRFKAHDSIENRKLLWHGTSVAVVVAILKTGLRIMPHSGGRVGRGIYFASENGKSAGYVGTTMEKNQRIGIMFLNEVVLGKEHHITRDDSSLVEPPKGYDCVIAKGHTEPDPKKDTTIEIDGKKIVVPQGKPIKTSYTNSSFSQSEYLVYKESQNRIRYLLKMKF